MLFDLLVVALILLGVVFGALKGFALQVAGILSLVAGFVVAIPVSAIGAPVFGSTAPLNRFIALAVIYFFVSLAIFVAAVYYRKAIEKWRLQEWDRHLGAVMGGIKGFMLCITLTFFAITLFSDLRQPILTTRAGWLMGQTMNFIHPVWPEEVHDIIHPYTHHLDEPEPEPGHPEPHAHPEEPTPTPPPGKPAEGHRHD